MDFYFVICLFFKEVFYTYMIMYIRCHSTVKLQYKWTNIDIGKYIRSSYAQM